MNKSRLKIIGYDAVSPLGTDLQTQWVRAAKGDSGIGHLTRFPIRDKFPVTIAGQVDDIDTDPYDYIRPRALALWPSPIFKYGMLVVNRALKTAGVEINADIAPRVGITFSTAIGGLDAVIEADRDLVREDKMPKPCMNPNSCINMITGKISMLTGATGPIATTITACATGNTSLIIGAMFIESGMADLVICGAVDFPLVESIVAGFASMNGAYKTKKSTDDESPATASRPFSKGRRGFIVSEGAACILLASDDFVKAHGLKAELELAGWATTADAYHYVAPNLPTVTRCIGEAISHAGLKPAHIDAVNGHAASTKVGDQVEAQALKAIFGSKVPPVSANKSQIGHAMGASSAIESVLALESMKHETLLPTINLDPDPKVGLNCLNEKALKLSQTHVLKNAFGFGGCNACVVFRKCE